jgi:hypothetical protein
MSFSGTAWIVSVCDSRFCWGIRGANEFILSQVEATIEHFAQGASRLASDPPMGDIGAFFQ